MARSVQWTRSAPGVPPWTSLTTSGRGVEQRLGPLGHSLRCTLSRGELPVLLKVIISVPVHRRPTASSWCRRTV